MNRFLRYLYIIAIGSMLIFFTVKCSDDEIQDESEKKIPVSLISIERSNVTIPIITSGKVTAQQEIKLSFKTGGVIENLYADEGDKVKKGEIIASINLQEINAQFTQARSAFKKAERDFARVKALHQDSVVTLEGFQNAKTALEVAEANLKIAQFNLDYSTIVAPANGQIYKKFAEINEIIAPGTPVYMFGSSSNNWKIVTGITDKDINRVRIGDSARIMIDAFPEKYLKARVSEIAGAIDPVSFTYEVELQIEVNEAKLFSGMVASVKIYPKSEGRFKAIPIKSIVNANEMSGEIYFVNDNNVAENRTVKINQIWNEMVLIESGLDDVDEVILDGVEYVYNGAKVNVQSVKDNNLGDF